ncbi:hypothetical protein IFM89_010999, partial [Coptis chinensis]
MDIPQDLLLQSQARWTTSLIGKLISDVPHHPNEILRAVRSKWNLKKKLDIVVLEGDLFVFRFEKEADKAKIIKEQPWQVLGYLLVLKAFSPNIPPSTVLFTTTPIWIGFTGLLLEHQLSIVIERIASDTGRVLEVDPVDNTPKDADGTSGVEVHPPPPNMTDEARNHFNALFRGIVSHLLTSPNEVSMQSRDVQVGNTSSQISPSGERYTCLPNLVHGLTKIDQASASIQTPITQIQLPAHQDLRKKAPFSSKINMKDINAEFVWDMITNLVVNQILLSQGVVLQSIWGIDNQHSMEEVPIVGESTSQTQIMNDAMEETFVEANPITIPFSVNTNLNAELEVDMDQALIAFYASHWEILSINVVQDYSLSILTFSLHHITTTVNLGPLSLPWSACFFYDNPHKTSRNQSWDSIRALQNIPPNTLILIIGDLNIILSAYEHIGGKPFEQNDCQPASTIIRDLGLLVLGFKGYPFMWSNKRIAPDNIQKRLDRGANMNEAEELLDALNLFCDITGQEINYEKS